MKVRILSDLHLEFQGYTPSPVDCDVVILAGDIDVKCRGVAWALKTFTQPIIYVPGNHEFYAGSLGHTLAKLRALANGTRVHLLSDDAVVLDGVRFLGATLWTDYRLTGNEPLARLDAQLIMNDFKKIRDERFSKLRPHHLSDKHSKSRNFLQGALEVGFSGPTVVVSHHAPCELSFSPRYKDIPGHLNASYASRMDHLFCPEVPLWVHGHLHDSASYEIGGTRVVCNPRGYAPSHLNPDFNPDLVVEV
jgi:UDP-2,3-diacylglucosamine pyrophosphatase LpxH